MLLANPAILCRTTDLAKPSYDTGLENELLLCKGARVMTTRNSWTSGGLVNGTMGTIYDIIWDEGIEDPFTTMPAVITIGSCG